jgi:hypothetical protein
MIYKKMTHLEEAMLRLLQSGQGDIIIHPTDGASIRVSSLILNNITPYFKLAQYTHGELSTDLTRRELYICIHFKLIIL